MMKYSPLLRALRENTVQVWISIIGLSIGLTCFVLSMYWYLHETNFDNFHNGYERINYVYVHSNSGNFDWDATPGAFAKSLSKYPEIESVTSFENYRSGMNCCYEQDTLKVLYYGVDTSFFHVFHLDFISGLPIKYPDTNDIVITESFASKLFRNKPALGQKIKLRSGGKFEKEFTVCGIVKDYPSNSNLKFDVLYHKDMEDDDDWKWFVFFTFIKLNPKTDADNFIRKYEADLEGKDNGEIRVVPINKMHLDFKTAIPSLSKGADEIKKGLSKEVILLFNTASLLVLFTALLNFIMLQVALLMGMTKEVTLRKLLGASIFSIMRFIILKLLVYFFISFFISLVLIEFFLPYVLDYVEISLSAYLLRKIIILLSIFVVVVLIFSSLYPTCKLMNVKIQNGLKGDMYGLKNGRFRNVMVFIQFIFACFILFFSIIIKNQMNFVRNTPLGIEIDNVYSISLPFSLRNSYQDIINEIQKNPDIELVTNFNSLRGVIAHRKERLKLPNGEYCSILEVNYDFQKLFNAKMKYGRFYSMELGDMGYNGDYRNMQGVSDVIIFNEKAAGLLEFKDPVGCSLDQFGTIIGIMEDYHSLSMREAIPPMAFLLNWNREEKGYLSIKIKPGCEKKLNLFMEAVIKKRDSSAVYVPLISMKQVYLNLYASENKVMFLLDLICALSLFISAMGIYSLALFAVKKRRKEVGIRKVLGSSIKQITRMLLKEYILLALLANIIALPFAYYASQRWLNGFAYHISIHVGYFILTFIIVLLIILFVISGQVWKVVKTNPVEVIKENN